MQTHNYTQLDDEITLMILDADEKLTLTTDGQTLFVDGGKQIDISGKTVLRVAKKVG